MKFIESFSWAAHGLRTVWREERNFRIEALIGTLALVGGAISGFVAWQWIMLVLIIALVLMGEIVNTAIEDICDKIQPDHDPVIGKIKDIMAGYVLVSSVAAIAAGIVLFFF